MEYSWTSQDVPLWAAVPTDYRVKNLVVPGPLAATDSGESYKLRLSARFKGSTQFATADVTLTAVASPLAAILTGPSGDVRSTSDIVLDASKSRDPDDVQSIEPLTYSFVCVNNNNPQLPCFDGAEQGTQADGMWQFPASLLDIDGVYTFTVTVTKDTRSAQASLTVRIRAADVPTGTLTRVCAGLCEPEHNTDTPLVVQLTIDGDLSATDVQWGMSEVRALLACWM